MKTCRPRIKSWLETRSRKFLFTACFSCPLTNVRLIISEIIEITDGPPKKKAKKASQSEAEAKPETSLEATIADQTKRMFEIRDQVKTFATPAILKKFFTYNNSGVVDGFENQLNRCADFLTFGAIDKCKRCKDGDFIFSKHGYTCNGTINEWTECGNFVAKPFRVECRIPEDLKSNKENFFKSFEQTKVEDRAVRTYVKYTGFNPHDIKVVRKREPLYNMHVVPFGNFSITRPQMKAKVEAMGGKLVTKLQPMIAVVISTEEDVEKMGARMREIKSLNIQVVPESFLDSIANGSPNDTLEAIKSMNMAEWGSDPLTRIPQEEGPGQKESIYSKGSKKVANVKLKNGAAIDPDSGLSDVAHVYQREGVVYTSVLGLADIKKNKNSYFKIQVLQSDDLRRLWLFSSWGRIGTKVGDSEKEEFSAAEIACVEFERLYKSKTGNTWNNRETFKKLPGKFYPIEVDYEDDKKLETLPSKPKVPSKLPEPVQELVKMLFDVEFMKQTMKEFDLDMVRMPLGRLSRKQLEEANQTLSDLSDLTARGAIDAEFIGLSNKFYTLVPHNFGMNQAPVIDTLEMIKNKRDMVESLLEIEIAYSMLQEDINEDLNPLDCRYEQLKTELKPLDCKTAEFKLIQQFVANTHAETHGHYKLVVEDVFKVKRQGEAARYKPFKKLHNRQLLWHGSRLTNYVGILSHGLKIAPPEAPASGYMFGKGIYFADMVSKSANYCGTSAGQQTGLMLLSEVALGDTHDLTRSHYVTQLPEGKHSVKGLGKTFPDPSMAHKRRDGVVVPLGTAMNKGIQTDLLYNEYIVYDAAQVNVQYLLKMKFDYNVIKT